MISNQEIGCCIVMDYYNTRMASWKSRWEGWGEVLKEGLEIQVGGVGGSCERGSGNPGGRGGGKS